MDYALAVAAAIGGTAEHGVALFEHRLALPVNRARLTSLPYGVPVDARLVCFDLETTGLATAAGTLAFLVGLGWWESDSFVVRQLLLTDHADEHALLDLLARHLAPDGWLVTYNGRSFDWPLIVARYRLHGHPPPPLSGHLDLLPISRQLWKHRTGSARLAAIEAEICGVQRTNDLPGAFIPDRYFTYLRSRRASLLRDVVDHNRQDIVSLGQLVAVLANLSLDDFEAGDLLGLARAYGRRGNSPGALEVIERALRPDAWVVRRPATVALHRRLSAERARLLARVGRREESIAAWLEIATRGGPGAAEAWLHVARYREHVERDVPGASAACHQAAAVAGRARAWGDPMLAVERDLERRLPRLSRRLFARRYQRRVKPAE
ncbi:MAG TPA: ribonuclease H-like domain-containing protein [Candidatus Limnocylindrales bacterium]